MAIVHAHGVIPDHLTERVIGRHQAKGRDVLANELTELMHRQRQTLSNRAIEFKNVCKEHKDAIKRQGILPDGQVVKTYSAKNRDDLRKAILMRNGPNLSQDSTVNEAYDGSAVTYDFLKEVFHRKSIDNRGLPLNSYVHFGKNYNNAYWDGRQMVYGDGDKRYFNRFTRDIDIPAHEQAHGLTDYEAGKNHNPKGTGINYEGQAGGINESYSDQIGMMVKQWQKHQKAEDSNWLVGEHLLIPKKNRQFALRSMIDPGKAFINHPALGTDTQIAHYADYLAREDAGETIDPHDGSGIPNKAFATAAITFGGPSWDKVGQVFFKTLPDVIPMETFAGLAQKTLAVARTAFKEDPRVEEAIITGWRSVGVLQ